MAEPRDSSWGAAQAGDGLPQLLQDRGAGLQRAGQPREGIQAGGRLAGQVQDRGGLREDDIC